MSKPVKFTREQIESVSHLSSRAAAEQLGTGKSTINDLRKYYASPKSETAKPAAKGGGKASSVESGPNGSLIIESTDSVPQTQQDVELRMVARGFNPEDYTYGYRFSEWEAQTPTGIQTLYSARATAQPKVKRLLEEGGDTVQDLFTAIENWVPIEGGGYGQGTETFIFCFADPQIGKVDFNGGTDATVARFMASLDRACELLEANPVAEIVWADLGDGIENFCNTPSQRQTNDMNLVEQVRVLRRLQLEGLMRLSAYAPIIHVSVPSNHSQNRIGLQAPAADSHDDWGIEVQQQLFDTFSTIRPDLVGNAISFLSPEKHYESVGYTTASGTRLGFVHGHRSTRQAGLEQWWAGQALGRQPVADADILLVGHFHNLSLVSVGDERYIITAPSLDNGSSWFTVGRGNVATAGVLTMRVQGKGAPSDLKIV